MKYFSFLVYLVAFIACHDDHHTEPELPQGQWTESHPFKGIPRTGGVSFTIGDVAYVGLGRTLPTATEALKDFWMYKDTTWTRIADFPGTERYGAVAFVLGNIAYVGTGYTPSTKNRADEFHHDFYAYDPSTGKWSDTPVTYLPPDAQGESNARKDAIAFSLNNKAYVGTGISPKNHALKDLYCFDGSTWTELYFPGEARYGASVFVIDDKAVICLGTSGANKTSYLVDVNIFDGITQEWYAPRPLVNLKSHQDDEEYDQIPRAYAIAFTSDKTDGQTKGYITTGMSPYLHTCWEYDIQKDHWRKVSDLPTPMTKRMYAVGFSLNGKGYITTGGLNSNTPIPADMWSFTP